MTAKVEKGEQRFHTFWLNLRGYSDKLLGIAVAVFGTVLGLHMEPSQEYSGVFDWWFSMSASARFWFWLVAGFAVLWILAVTLLQRPSYAALVRGNEKAERSSSRRADAIEAALRSVLRQLGVHCKADGNEYRTSIFYYHDGKFVALARDSRHPERSSLRSDRDHYDASLGVIAEAWRGSEYYKIDLPGPRGDWESKIVKLFGYSRDQAAKFRMQSRSYAAIRIDGPSGPVGVLMFESTRARGVSKETIKAANNSLIRVALAEMVHMHAQLTPQVEKATSEPEKTPKARPPRPWVSNTTVADVVIDVMTAR